jgi:hypothetical protein
MKKLTAALIVMALFFSPLLKADDLDKLWKTNLKESMIMLGLYVYGLDREAGKTVTDYSSVEFLSESIVRYGKALKALKGDDRFQTNLDNMILQAETLNKYSTKNHRQVGAQIEAVSNSCAACHKMGSDPYAGTSEKK